MQSVTSLNTRDDSAGMTAQPEDQDGELIDDLSEVVRGLRAYLEWQQVVGSTGIPRDPRPAQAFQPAVEAAPDTLPRALVPPSPSVDPASSMSAPASRVVAVAPRDARGTPLIADPEASRPDPRRLLIHGCDMGQLEAMVKDCAACELHRTRKQTVFSRGTGASGLCFVGEGPGADEDEQGYPFVGAAGQLLDRMITAMGFTREEVYVCNIVKCRPPNNRKPNEEEMHLCRPFVERQLALLKPQVIVALGATAVAGLLGETRGITKIRGTFRLYEGRIAVMPTFHPAYLLRNPAAKREVWSDLQQVVEHLGRTLPRKT